MKSKLILSAFIFIACLGISNANAYYGGIPYNSYSYRTVYPSHHYNRYGYGYGYYSRNSIRRHPIKDKRELKYLREYNAAMNGYDYRQRGNTYQNGNKVVNVNIDM